MRYSVPTMCMIIAHKNGSEADARRDLMAARGKLEHQLEIISAKLDEMR